jgi:hypothetical protein
MTSEVECQSQIQGGVKMRKEDKGLISTRRTTLVKYKVLKKYPYFV